MNDYLFKFIDGTVLPVSMDGVLPENIYAAQCLQVGELQINTRHVMFAMPRIKDVPKDSTGVVKPVKPDTVVERKKKQRDEYLSDPEKILEENKKRAKQEEGLE